MQSISNIYTARHKFPLHHIIYSNQTQQNMKKLYTTLCLIGLTMAAAAQTALHAPEAKPATAITTSSFTANWAPVEGAEAYCVFVYDRQTVATDGEQTLADEDFNGITSGSENEPLGGSDRYVDLCEYGYALTYGWSAYAYPTFIPSMVAGLVYSPYLDLRSNGGEYKVIVTSYCSDGDEIRVTSHGAGETVIQSVTAHIENGGTGLSTDTLTFGNGSKDLFFTVINNTAKEGSPDYFDRIQVKQTLRAGDVINKMVASNEAVEATGEMMGDSVTSCRFTSVGRYTSSKVLYYDLYATAMDFSTPNGSLPYTALYSDFSKLVKVDLSSRTSEVIDETTAISRPTIAPVATDGWFTFGGQRVAKPTKGIYIHNGKKTIIK